jgi:hypothetical protein
MLQSSIEQQPSAPDIQTASAQFRAWIESEAGKQIWHTKEMLPSVERICYALDNTKALTYGLLVTPEFFRIFSTMSIRTFARYADRYQTAAKSGLCFWWDKTTLHHCEHSDEFITLLHTLPPPHIRHQTLSALDEIAAISLCADVK